MNWSDFQTYGQDPKESFEILCSRLYEHFLRRKHGIKLVKFRVVNGDGGDGGVEAYAELENGDMEAMQAKWFRESMKKTQFDQIENSIKTAMALRPLIKRYTICIPHQIWSLRYGRGKAGSGASPTKNHEEAMVEAFVAKIKRLYPDLELVWWFEEALEEELIQPDNEGVHKYFFEKEIITIQKLIDEFDKQRYGWLRDRYIPQLHGKGIIQDQIESLLYTPKFRKKLEQRLNDILLEILPVERLVNGIDLTNLSGTPLYAGLLKIKDYIKTVKQEIKDSWKFIERGYRIIQEKVTLSIPDIDKLLPEIELLVDTDVNRQFKASLPDALEQLVTMNVAQRLEKIWSDTRQTGRLFLGNPGTGKTHALANTVEQHLKKNCPALIIRAKGSSSGSWSDLLRRSIDLSTWSENEILAALEIIARRKEVMLQRERAMAQAGQPVASFEAVQVIIAVDGLEEDVEHWNNWYERINESIYLMGKYPSLRFVYTARSYFEDSAKLSSSETFKLVLLPEEGDVSVMELAPKYFANDQYNIQVESWDIVRGIDNLFALRLFCELYKGRTIATTDEVETAEEKLLMKKVEQINTEFVDSLSAPIGKSHHPVLEALQSIADQFYLHPSVEHSALLTAVSSKLIYLPAGEVSRLIDLLVDHGMLTKESYRDMTSAFVPPIIRYALPYQSIMELIMSDKLFRELRGEEHPKLPVFLLSTSAPMTPFLISPDDRTVIKKGETPLINLRIIENVASLFLQEEGKLIGEKDFLSEGLADGEKFALQMRVLLRADIVAAGKYKPRLRKLFETDRKARFDIFSHLILPASVRKGNLFGADFLHEILSSQPSAFARDQIWMGQDKYSIDGDGKRIEDPFDKFHLQHAFQNDEKGIPVLSNFATHDEMPLVYAWGLSTLDQRFRNGVRVAIAQWALAQPVEFIRLLDKLFAIADPQIQEDLASIAMAIAGKLNGGDAMRLLAEWVLDNIFKNQNDHRNVIVRQGFRAVVERAYQYKLVTDQQVNTTRPRIQSPVTPLLLDKDALSRSEKEMYPIEHDLAWYVIKKAYNNFLPITAPGTQSKSVEKFFDAFKIQADTTPLGSSNWSMSAAIGYMKSMGFDRTVGNSTTKATHGSKSPIFTGEEKYTWLAVHYLQGYLSDFLPFHPNHSGPAPLIHYGQLAEIPNPADASSFLNPLPEKTVPSLLHELVIKEPLTPELDGTVTPDQAINDAVNKQPELHPSAWLEYNSRDFWVTEDKEEWLAIYNYSLTEESRKYMNTSFEARAVIIDKGLAPGLLDSIIAPGPRFHSLSHLDGLEGLPDTDIYSNPSDLIWMDWIGEVENEEPFYLADGTEKKVFTAVTRVVTAADGEEKSIKMPSIAMRKLLDIVAMEKGVYFNSAGKPVALYHNYERKDNNRQELLLVNKTILLDTLNKSDRELVWLADVFKTKNALNSAISSSIFPRKCRKYFAWLENGGIQWQKVWEEEFCNAKDTDPV